MSPAKKKTAGAKLSQPMPSPSPQILRADGMLDLDSPTASNVLITCSSESGFSAPDPAAAVDSQVTFLLFFFNRIYS
jgi:hypothetical protein